MLLLSPGTMRGPSELAQGRCNRNQGAIDYVFMTTKARTFTIILEPAEEGGFIVTVPALPEVGTQGETYDEAVANAREAIELVIEDRQASGEPIPPD